tara:strand:+ start:1599 stop:2102 length:504 start_codon:yes stop_codon:yes gene_type:complete
MKINSFGLCDNCIHTSKKIQQEFDENQTLEYTEPVNIIDNIYIGNINSTVDGEKLKKNNFKYIITVGNNISKFAKKTNIDYIEFLVDDSLEQDMTSVFKNSLNIVNNIKNGNILIHCYSGISRSASTIIYILMKKYDMNFMNAFNYLKNIHPKAHPNSNFINQLKLV